MKFDVLELVEVTSVVTTEVVSDPAASVVSTAAEARTQR